MIRYIRHNQIDRHRWDACVSASGNRLVYAFSWYLDIVSPGWDGLAEEDYSAVFPLTHRRKWGIAYLYQPFFTQQLGLFSKGLPEMSRVTSFIQAIPQKFRYTDIHLNSGNPLREGISIAPGRINHVLDLARPADEIRREYSTNAIRNIRKAEKYGLDVTWGEEPDRLVDLFRSTFGEKEGKLGPPDYKRMNRLMVRLMAGSSGSVRFARDSAGIVHAGAFFAEDAGRWYFLFAASAPVARESGAMFYLIDRFIAEWAGKADLLDFEGGNDPDLARFYAGFGASALPYPVLRFSRLPAAAEKGLYFMRQLKG